MGADVMSTGDSFTPTTTCSILRTDGAPEDEFGDPVDNETVSSSGVYISIIETTTRQYLPAEKRLTVIRSNTARLRADVDVKETDRIKDELSGEIYTIENLVKPSDPNGSVATRLELKRIT